MIKKLGALRKEDNMELSNPHLSAELPSVTTSSQDTEHVSECPTTTARVLPPDLAASTTDHCVDKRNSSECLPCTQEPTWEDMIDILDHLREHLDDDDEEEYELLLFGPPTYNDDDLYTSD